MDLFESAKEMQKFANTWADKEDVGEWRVDEVFAMIDDFFDVAGLKWGVKLEDRE